MAKKLTRERLQQIIREEKQRLRRIKKEAQGEVTLDESGDFAVSDGAGTTLTEDVSRVGTEGSTWSKESTGGESMDRLQELAGVNEEPEPEKTAMRDTLDMMDEVRDTITDRRVLEQLAKTIDDETFQEALREIAQDENIQLY